MSFLIEIVNSSNSNAILEDYSSVNSPIEVQEISKSSISNLISELNVLEQSNKTNLFYILDTTGLMYKLTIPILFSSRLISGVNDLGGNVLHVNGISNLDITINSKWNEKLSNNSILELQNITS